MDGIEKYLSDKRKFNTSLTKQTQAKDWVNQFYPEFKDTATYNEAGIFTPNMQQISTLGVQTPQRPISPFSKIASLPANYSTERQPVNPVLQTLPENKPVTNTYSASKYLKLQGKPTGYINEGNKQGIQEFNYGGKMKKFYNNGGNMFDYYNTQLNNDQQLASGILGTVGGIAGNIIAPGIGGEIGGGLGKLAGNLFANGGNMITQIPNSAGTHEQNPNEGVNINNYDSSVEGNETIDNKNKFVFSNRLTPLNSKRSYASLTKPLIKKLELRPDDKMTKDYVQSEMDKLAEDQEAQKAYMDIMNDANKLYGGLMALGGEMKKGGWIQKAVNPAHKGYCTPMTKSTCTPHRKALAMTFKKHHGFHKKANGGTLDDLYEEYKSKAPGQFESKDSLIARGDYTPDYLNSLLGYESVINPNINQGYPANNMPVSMQPNQFSTSSPMLANFKTGNTNYLNSLKFSPNIQQTNEVEDLVGNKGIPEKTRWQAINPEGNYNDSQLEANDINSQLNMPVIPDKSKKRSLAGYSQLLGPASQMITSLAQRNKDLANLNYRVPEFTPIDEFYAANLAKQTQDQQSAQISNAIRSTANDPGSYLAAMLAANSGLLSAGSQPANLAYQANVANTAGRNQNAQIKADIQNRNIDEREKLLDNARTQFTNSLYNAGVPITGLDRDYRQGEQFDKTNQLFLKNMQTSGYTFDKDGNIIPKRKYGGKMTKYKK